MIEFDRQIAAGYTHICGVDEAGRGPLAGPVVAAACVFSLDCNPIDGINDSKKITEKNRELLYGRIINQAIAYHVAIMGNDIVDRINVLQATKLAMQEAIAGIKADIVLIDGLDMGFDCFNLTVPYKTIVKGDSKSYMIAAASILAKVTRDRIMLKADLEFPEYGFAKHKGYGTPSHIVAIKKFGLSPIHRKTFTKNFI